MQLSTPQPARLLILIWTSAAFIGSPGLADPLRRLEFSPDGHYMLAQDDYEIAVLTVAPLAVSFRIHEFAGDAHFTPDSRQIVFVVSLARAGEPTDPAARRVLLTRFAPRVERWNVANATLAGRFEIKGLTCQTEELSADGNILACSDSKGTLRLVDVLSGGVFFERKQFVKLIPLYSYTANGAPDLPNGQFLGDAGEACFDFSPDGHLLKARACGGTGTELVYDLQSWALMPLKRSITRHPSIFVNANELLINDGPYHPKQHLKTVKLVAFPSGRLLAHIQITPFGWFRATEPGFIISRSDASTPNLPPRGPTTALDIRTEEAIVSQTPALDVCGRYYVAEPSSGVVGLYEQGHGLRATLNLH
jgi:hypothetical protein